MRKGSRRCKWFMGFLCMVLVVGFVVTNVVTADDDGDKHKNPFTQILNKLNEILAKLNSGGGQDGNYTLRWDQALPGAQRFVILPAFNNDAVLDKNTGLVWEKSPATTSTTWIGAISTCINKSVGGQKGWRLPAIAELASLVDPSVSSPGPTLPPGHPFLDVQSVRYWSATSYADNPTGAWFVSFGNGNVSAQDKTFSHPVWCMRGGMNADQY